MEKEGGIKIYIDPYGNTVNFWWGDPKDSVYSKEAADSCPVNVIHIIDKETGKKII